MRRKLSFPVGCALLLGLGCSGSASLHASVDATNAGGTGHRDGGEVSGSTASGGSSASGGTRDAGATNASGGNGTSAGTGSSAGSGGSAGTGAGSGGLGGKGGVRGKGGNAGAPGSGGNAGAPGSGGNAGAPGSGGNAGAPGSGGSGGAAGAVGQGGSGGSSGAGAPSTGVHVLAEQSISVGNQTITSAGINTQVSGSSLIVTAGRGTGSKLLASTISDNKGNSPFVQQGSKLNWAGYPDSSAALYAVLDAKGGAGHTFTLSDLFTDEGTIVAVEVKHGLVVKDVKGARMDAGNLTSPSVTTTGPATIVAFCWGGGGFGISSISANNSFAILDKYGGQDGLSVQVASASRDVSAAGTYNVTWTVSPAQEAILFIIALQ